LGAPVCLPGGICTKTTTFLCGDHVSCVDTGTKTACTGTTNVACLCDCTLQKTPVANFCLGQATSSAGATTACTLGATAGCNYKATIDKYGQLKSDVCIGDSASAQCQCGTPIYPLDMATIYSAKASCASNSDCQSLDRSSDTRAICACTTSSGVTTCTTCKIANAANLASATCLVNADCGWGSCMTADFASKCPGTGLIAASTCVCVPAGCVGDRQCGLSYSAATCGGIPNACAGKCNCG